MTNDMKPYIDQLSEETTTDDTLYEDAGGELTEGFLKTASKLVLFNKVRTLSGQVKKEKNTVKKLDLIASQNTHIAALFLIKN